MRHNNGIAYVPHESELIELISSENLIRENICLCPVTMSGDIMLCYAALLQLRRVWVKLTCFDLSPQLRRAAYKSCMLAMSFWPSHGFEPSLILCIYCFLFGYEDVDAEGKSFTDE